MGILGLIVLEFQPFCPIFLAGRGYPKFCVCPANIKTNKSVMLSDSLLVMSSLCKFLARPCLSLKKLIGYSYSTFRNLTFIRMLYLLKGTFRCVCTYLRLHYLLSSLTLWLQHMNRMMEISRMIPKQALAEAAIITIMLVSDFFFSLCL